jgi:anti-sigma factor RsiW
MNHDEISELLGAYALDAVDPDEREEIRLHLVDCPRCAAEVAEHWEVTGLIANVGVDAPAELWDRIAARIDDTTGGDRRPAPRHLTSTASAPPRSITSPRRRLAWSAVGTVAAAAAVVAVLLAVQVGRLDQRVGQLAAATRQAGMAQAVQAALLDPGAHTVSLTSMLSGPAPGGSTPTSGGRVAVIVVLPDGSAYVLNTGLPPLASDRTYQLWGVVHGQTVSLGLLGSAPHDVAFTVDPSAPVKAFAVTDEVAGGVVRSVHTPVASTTT